MHLLVSEVPLNVVVRPYALCVAVRYPRMLPCALMLGAVRITARFLTVGREATRVFEPLFGGAWGGGVLYWQPTRPNPLYHRDD